MKAMILAAGRGQRLRPLTDHTPKPLAPFRDGRLIEPLLRSLHQAGIHEVVINICHLAAQIMNYLGDGRRYGLHIQYSHEEQTGSLETGGGVYRALPLLGSSPFWVVSADIVTDFDFGQLINKPLSGLGHLILVDNPDFHPHGDFHLSADGGLALEGDHMLTFANISILHPQLFADCVPGKFPLSQLFREAIAAKKLTGQHHRGGWHNIGTLSQLINVGGGEASHDYKNN